MFLATTALSEFWDSTDHLLFLGPWCTLHNQREKWAHLDYAMLPNPWDDQGRFHQAGLYCRQVYEHLLEELASYLNRVHMVNFGLRYWRILVGPWPLSYVDAFYDRYVCLTEALGSFPQLHTWLLREEDYRTPNDFGEFQALNHQSDLYNLQLYSQISESLGYNFPKKDAGFTGSGNGTQPEGKRNIISGIKRSLRNIIIDYLLIQHSKNGVYFLLSNIYPKLMVKLRLTPGFQARFLNHDFPQDWRFQADASTDHRKELVHLTSSSDRFVKVLLDSLPKNLPSIYLEGFQASRQYLGQHFEGKRFPRILMTLAGLWSAEFGRFLAAEMTEREGKIINIQVGAGYGMARRLGIEKHDRDVSDRFYCWGWADQENDPKLINLPAPKLSAGERRAGTSQKRQTILVVGTANPRYLYRFQSYPVGLYWEQYLRGPAIFFQELDHRLQQKTLYRGYATEYGWYITQRLTEQVPRLEIDDHRHSFGYWLNQSRLVVMDYPGTTFLEAMAAGVPLIMFFNPLAWQMREEALPYFESLRQASILHDTPQSAALQVEKIYDNVDGWWLSDPVQAARQKFVDHFALRCNAWNRHWVEMMRQELSDKSW